MGKWYCHMVDGLTKIVEIREHEFVTSNETTDSKNNIFSIYF